MMCSVSSQDELWAQKSRRCDYPSAADESPASGADTANSNRHFHSVKQRNAKEPVDCASWGQSVEALQLQLHARLGDDKLLQMVIIARILLSPVSPSV
ncbi:unnamed protein product [Phytophthora fragariaefolia]|uniref:Unnamed protein product n=1 Tax=Phytophthora fragariaefolia TaxID=1490495 RepID=A0A9W7D6F5_9STRA|nr:unnamed protein product [Phytophthora fragariaefolia]